MRKHVVPVKVAGAVSILVLISSTLFGVAAAAAEDAGAGAEEADCSQIENARERLACFDRRYPRDDSKPNYIPSEAPRIVSEPIRPRQGEAGTTGAAPAAPRPATAPAPAAESGSSAPAGAEEENPDLAPLPKKGGIFDAPTKVEITSTLAAIKAEDQKKMVFRLANGQIWIQVAARDLPFKKGDEVTIKSGTIGGYILRNAKGTSTRVKRIK